MENIIVVCCEGDGYIAQFICLFTNEKEAQGFCEQMNQLCKCLHEHYYTMKPNVFQTAEQAMENA